MDKLAIGPGYPEGTIDLTKSPTENIRAIAKAKGVEPGDIIACVLDRPRHESIIAELRALGCGIQLIPDGDVAGVIAVTDPDRKSVVEGKSVSVRVDTGGRRLIKKKKQREQENTL